MKVLTFFATLSLLFVFSCVPQQQYTELEQTLEYYKSEALATDSIRAANQVIQDDNSQTQREYQSLTRELERLTATNISLNRNYQDIVARYNNLVGDNQEVLAASSYETLTLEQELSLRRQELDVKDRSLNQVENQLRDRNAELQQMEARGAYNSPTGYDAVPDARFNQLSNEKATMDQQRAALVSYFQRVLVGFPNEEVAIETYPEGVRLILNKALLFPQGESSSVNWKGRQALQQISVVLRDNPELPVHVTGHINPSTNVDYDWEMSLARALTVSKDLATYGVDAGRIVTAGKGSNEPIVAATNARAQIVNGRTVIEVPMGYMRLLNGLGGN